MTIQPYLIILGLTLFFPFEDFVLKWLPVSDRVYSIARIGSEFLIYGLLALVVYHRLYNGRRVQKTPIDNVLITFIILALASIYFNDAPLLGGLINLRALIRYIAVYYTIVNLNINENQVQKIIYCMILVAVGESLIAWIQHFSGIHSFWLPRPTELEVEGYKKVFTIMTRSGIEKGAAIGTFGHSVSMSLYLLISSILLLAGLLYPQHLPHKKKLNLILSFLLIVSGILFSYSRGSFFALFLVAPSIMIMYRQKRLLFRALGIVSAILLFFLFLSTTTRNVNVKSEYVDPMSNLSMIFTERYMESSKLSRQWILREVGSAILQSGTLMGFSPHEDTAKRRIAQLGGTPLRRIITYKAFEDVFWVALLAYYGLIGIVLILAVLYRLFKCSRMVILHSQSRTFTVISVSMAALIIVNIPLSFLVRTFEFRTFGFYFWLLAGLMMAEYIRLMSRARIKGKQSDGYLTG